MPVENKALKNKIDSLIDKIETLSLTELMRIAIALYLIQQVGNSPQWEKTVSNLLVLNYYCTNEQAVAITEQIKRLFGCENLFEDYTYYNIHKNGKICSEVLPEEGCFI